MSYHYNIPCSSEYEMNQKARELAASGFRRVLDFKFLEPGEFRTNIVNTRENSLDQIPARYDIEVCEKS